MEPGEGLAPSTTIYETVILLVKLTRHIGCRRWIRTTDLQLMRLARTTGLLYSAINLVPHDRIELPYPEYKTGVIPLYEKVFERPTIFLKDSLACLVWESLYKPYTILLVCHAQDIGH